MKSLFEDFGQCYCISYLLLISLVWAHIWDAIQDHPGDYIIIFSHQIMFVVRQEWVGLGLGLRLGPGPGLLTLTEQTFRSELENRAFSGILVLYLRHRRHLE